MHFWCPIILSQNMPEPHCDTALEEIQHDDASIHLIQRLPNSIPLPSRPTILPKFQSRNQLLHPWNHTCEVNRRVLRNFMCKSTHWYIWGSLGDMYIIHIYIYILCKYIYIYTWKVSFAWVLRKSKVKGTTNFHHSVYMANDTDIHHLVYSHLHGMCMSMGT